MTLYRLASSPQDYRRCHLLLTQTELPAVKFGWPTVVAERGKTIVAFLGTVKSTEAVMAGPLALGQLKNPIFVFLNLVQAYENVLRAATVTSYVFSIPATMKQYISVATEIIGPPYTKDEDGDYWFERKI